MASDERGRTDGTRRLEEARRSLDAQIEKIQTTDRVAVNLFRVNIVFAGILLTGLSLTVRSQEFTVGQFVNACSVFGLVALWFALFSSAVTYTTTSIDLGVSGSFLKKANRGEHGRRDEFEGVLVEKYDEWMSHNAKVATVNRYLLVGSIIVTLSAVNLFTAGAFVGLQGVKLTLIDIGLLIITLLVSVVAGAVIWYSQDALTGIVDE